MSEKLTPAPRADALPMWMEEALTIAKSDALFADRVDWDEVRSQVIADAERAVVAGVPERVLAPLFRALSDSHSFIERGGPREDGPLEDAAASAPPKVETLPSGIGVLQLPGMPDPKADSSCSYQQLGLESIATLEGVDRLIVDLRGNGGGNCYPMLAVLAPILGAGPLVGWEPRTGVTEYVEYDGHALTRQGWETAPPWAKRPERIAVLADVDTASSGEGVACGARTQRVSHVRDGDGRPHDRQPAIRALGRLHDVLGSGPHGGVNWRGVRWSDRARSPD